MNDDIRWLMCSMLFCVPLQPTESDFGVLFYGLHDHQISRYWILFPMETSQGTTVWRRSDCANGLGR
ncbi:hypothetical protein TNCV_2967071 [Trichonephila clavipes]|nr:hypothetical protein TNCV_2967071 [Trichonephila clavipes]